MTSSSSQKPRVHRPFADFSVPIGHGKELYAKPDDTFARRDIFPPPTHPQIQSEATAFGKEMGDRFMMLDKPTRHESIKRMRDLAEVVEQQNADLLPKRHKEKVAKLMKHGITAAKFRAIGKNLDEATQSKTTEAMHAGFTSAIKADNEGKELQFHYLRVQSSMRMRTKDVVGPVREESSKEILGQQHPTSPHIPRVKGGSSSHDHADRERAHAAVSDGRHRAKSDKGVLGPMLHAVVTAGAMALDRMALPLTASNVAGDQFSQSKRIKQTRRRETFKRLVNTVAIEAGIAVDSSMQPASAPKRRRLEPTSPARPP